MSCYYYKKILIIYNKKASYVIPYILHEDQLLNTYVRNYLLKNLKFKNNEWPYHCMKLTLLKLDLSKNENYKWKQNNLF